MTSKPEQSPASTGVVGGVLSTDTPRGWRQRQELTLVERDGRANVLCSVSEVTDPDLTTETYARAQDAALAEGFPGFRPIAFEPARMLGGHAGMRHHFVWEPQGSPPVEQLQMYLVLDRRLYIATATAPVDDWEELAPALERALLGLRIAPAGPPGAPMAPA